MAIKPDKQAKVIFYPTPPTSEATSQVTLQAASREPSPSAPSAPIDTDMHYYLTEGLKEAVHRKFIDSRSFAGAVRSQTRVAEATSGGTYVVFSPVSEGQLTKVDELRDDHYKKLRFMYLQPQQTLIVKIMPGPVYEITHIEFVDILREKVSRMGLRRDLCGIGGTRYQGRASKKEADSAFKPRSRPGGASWPTLVLESGVSETIERLRVDANWWIMNSSGAVNIVLIFSVKMADRTIEIEQWEADSPPNDNSSRTTRSSPPIAPKCAHTISIPLPDNHDDKPALTLDFKKVFDREPVKDTLDADIEFTALDLSEWFADLWHYGG